MPTWCIDIRQWLLIGPEHRSWPKRNDDKKAPEHKRGDTGRSNDCHGQVSHSPNIFLINSAATPGPNNTQRITPYKRYSILVMRLSPSRSDLSMLLYLSRQSCSCADSFASVSVTIFISAMITQQLAIL